MVKESKIVKNFFRENATLETVVHIIKLLFVIYISYIVLTDNIISIYFYLLLGLGNLMNAIKFYYSYRHCKNIWFLYSSSIESSISTIIIFGTIIIKLFVK